MVNHSNGKKENPPRSTTTSEGGSAGENSARLVNSQNRLAEWRDQVQSDDRFSDDWLLRYLLLSLASPNMLDRDTWTVPYHPKWLEDASDVDVQTIYRRQEKLLSLPYVEEAGEYEYTSGRGRETRTLYALRLPGTEDD